MKRKACFSTMTAAMMTLHARTTRKIAIAPWLMVATTTATMATTATGSMRSMERCNNKPKRNRNSSCCVAYARVAARRTRARASSSSSSSGSSIATRTRSPRSDSRSPLTSLRYR